MKIIFNPLLEDGFQYIKETIRVVSSDPTNADDFDIIFNTVDNQIKIYYGSLWYVLHTLTILGTLLLETSDKLLLETGYKILLEE